MRLGEAWRHLRRGMRFVDIERIVVPARSSVSCSPSRSPTFGCQPSTCWASEMSGRRTFGSSIGSASCTIPDFDEVSSTIVSASSSKVNSSELFVRPDSCSLAFLQCRWCAGSPSSSISPHASRPLQS